MNIFDSYNAKHLKSDEIVKTFVSSKLFLETAKNGHSILVGPRGSGKTTFLRMLSNDTLYKWHQYNEQNIKDNISYEGIYVPGDLVWGEMLNSLESLDLDKKYSDGFSYTAFSTHVFINCIEAIEISLNKVEVEKGPEYLNSRKTQISEALVSISDILKLNLEVTSLSRVRLALNKKLVSLGEYARYLYSTPKVSEEAYKKNVPYAYMDLKTTLESIVSAIDFALDRPEHRWALLFDEFEIAPKFLLDKVINAMRSSAKKLMFKVALVPCGLHQEVKSLTSSINDYTVTELWYVTKGESVDFCKNLIKVRYGIEDPEFIFGNTHFGSTKTITKKVWLREFKNLAEKDLSFVNYLSSQKLDYRVQLSGGSPPNSLIRKMSPIVAFRNAFLNKNGVRKGRKSLSEFYTGWDAISRISEGNPRWLISVLNTLITTEHKGKVKTSDQMQRISVATDAYCAMLKTVPLTNNMGITSNVPIFTLMNTIATYFNKRFIDDDFRPSQPNTFTIDNNVPPETEAALMIAWNYGAIVAVESENTFGKYDDLKGMRFRLSFLTTPKFELPLRTDQSISLSTILSNKPNVTNHIEVTKQGELF